MWLLHERVVSVFRPETLPGLGHGSKGECIASFIGATLRNALGPADHRPRPQSRRRWSPAPRMCARLWAGPCCCAALSSEAAPSASPPLCGASKGSCCLRRPPSRSPPRPWIIPSCTSTLSPATAAAATSAASPTTWAQLSASSRSRVSIPRVPPHPTTPTWAQAPPQLQPCPRLAGPRPLCHAYTKFRPLAFLRLTLARSRSRTSYKDSTPTSSYSPAHSTNAYFRSRPSPLRPAYTCPKLRPC